MTALLRSLDGFIATANAWPACAALRGAWRLQLQRAREISSGIDPSGALKLMAAEEEAQAIQLIVVSAR